MDENRPVNRREVLLGAIALVGGASALTACSREDRDQLDLHSGDPAFFDHDQMRLVSRIVDIVIPETDTPGALGANVPTFLDQLMANWASAATQEKHVALLQAVDSRAAREFGSVFVDCAPERQLQILTAIDEEAYSEEPALPYFRELKRLIVAGYYTSEIGATVELQFELVPGRYIPCAPIDEIGRAWA